jgi:hypothetical protein
VWKGVVKAEIRPRNRFYGVGVSPDENRQKRFSDQITRVSHYNDCDRLGTKYVEFYGLTKIPFKLVRSEVDRGAARQGMTLVGVARWEGSTGHAWAPEKTKVVQPASLLGYAPW